MVTIFKCRFLVLLLLLGLTPFFAAGQTALGKHPADRILDALFTGSNGVVNANALIDGLNQKGTHPGTNESVFGSGGGGFGSDTNAIAKTNGTGYSTITFNGGSTNTALTNASQRIINPVDGTGLQGFRLGSGYLWSTFPGAVPTFGLTPSGINSYTNITSPRFIGTLNATNVEGVLTNFSGGAQLAARSTLLPRLGLATFLTTYNGTNWYAGGGQTNIFAHTSETLLLQQLTNWINNGMLKFGYDSFCLEEGYQNGQSFPNVNATTYPNGMQFLTDKFHKNGMKIGIYTDLTGATCAGLWGIGSNIVAGANLFAYWGFDYVHFDTCNSGNPTYWPAGVYGPFTEDSRRRIVQDFVAALRATNSNIGVTFNMNETPYAPWIGEICNGWQIAPNGDFPAYWTGLQSLEWAALSAGQFRKGHTPSWYPFGQSVLTKNGTDSFVNGYNGIGMLTVGGAAMWQSELQLPQDPVAYEGVWASLGSGNVGVHLVTNKYILRIDQDPLFNPPTILATNGTVTALIKKLDGGDMALLVYNKGYAAAQTFTNYLVTRTYPVLKANATNIVIPITAFGYRTNELATATETLQFTNMTSTTSFTFPCTTNWAGLWLIKAPNPEKLHGDGSEIVNISVTATNLPAGVLTNQYAAARVDLVTNLVVNLNGAYGHFGGISGSEGTYVGLTFVNNPTFLNAALFGDANNVWLNGPSGGNLEARIGNNSAYGWQLSPAGMLIRQTISGNGGGISNTIAAVAVKTTDYTATTNDAILNFNGTALNATLPDATNVNVKKHPYVIKNLHASTLSINRTSGQTIDGVAANDLLAAGQSRTYASDGTNWIVVADAKIADGTWTVAKNAGGQDLTNVNNLQINGTFNAPTQVVDTLVVNVAVQSTTQTSKPAYWDAGGNLVGSNLVSDVAFASSWNSKTTDAPSKNAVYDWGHLFDTDDDGKVNVLDQGVGVAVTDSGGVLQTPITTSAGLLAAISDLNSATRTLTGVTLDVAGAGNIVNTRQYIPLRGFDNVIGANPINTNDYNTVGFMRPRFLNGTAASGNYLEWRTTFPEDVNAAVSMRGKVKIRLSGADTGAHRYILSMASVADSASSTGTPGNAVNLDLSGDGSGASGDVETTAWVTLTSWASTVTAGQEWVIRLARDGNSGTDTSTVDSDFIEAVIEYGSTQ